MDVPETITKLLKEEDVVFPQGLTIKEEFGNDFEDLPVYEDYPENDMKEEGLEDIEQVVQLNYRSDAVSGLCL